MRTCSWFVAVMGTGFFAARIILGDIHPAALVPNLGKPLDLKLSLPGEVAGWRQVKAGPDHTLAETLGVRSIVWHFVREGVEAVVAVDYPLEGFHNVKSCYQNNGWQIASEEKIGPDFPAFKDTMLRSVCQHAVVYHAVLNERGQWLLPPVRKNALGARLLGEDPAVYQTSYRIQALTGAYTAPSDETVACLHDLFVRSSSLLRQELTSQSK